VAEAGFLRPGRDSERKAMKIVVIGGTGMLGSKVVALLTDSWVIVGRGGLGGGLPG
jgi:hypothetical protein